MMKVDIVKTIWNYLTFKNQSSLLSTIPTDTSRIYSYDDGSSVHLMATKDDATTETQVEFAEMSSIAALSTKPGGDALYFGGSTSYLNEDLLAAHLVNTNNTKGMIAFCGQIHNIADGEDYLWTFGDTNADELIALYTSTTDGKLICICKVAGVTQWQFETTSAEVAVDTDYRIVLFQDGTAPYLSINGRLIAITFSVSTDKTKWFANTTGIDNGRVACSNYNSGGNINNLNCTLGYFNAWNTTLSVAAIDKILQAKTIPYKYVGANLTNLLASATWTNNGFDIFTSSGNQITNGTDDGTSAAVAYATAFTFVMGKTYRLSYTLGGTWTSGNFSVGFYQYNDATGNYMNRVYHNSGTTSYSTTFTATYSGTFYFCVRNNVTAITSLTLSSPITNLVGCDTEHSKFGHYSAMDESGNGLHATNSGGLPFGHKIGDRVTAYLSTTSTTPTMTDVIKGGWKVAGFSFATAQNLTVIDATQETSSIKLIDGKAVNNGILNCGTIADHYIYEPDTDKDIVFTLTGNGGAGTVIKVVLEKVK